MIVCLEQGVGHQRQVTSGTAEDKKRRGEDEQGSKILRHDGYSRTNLWKTVSCDYIPLPSLGFVAEDQEEGEGAERAKKKEAISNWSKFANMKK